jgi:hypothetical protein
MLLIRTCLVIICMTFVLLGCSRELPPQVSSVTDKFEAHWRCVDKTDRSFYIGEKRWCLFDRDPKKSWIDGKLTASKTMLSSVINVNLEKVDTTNDKLRLWNGENEVIELVLVRENNLLHVVVIEDKSHILNGCYRYLDTSAPVKGPNVHEWGRQP